MTRRRPRLDRPFRPCVGIMLLNRDGRVFVGNRADVDGDHWQMPQGGIDPGETPRAAALRELVEETGTDKAEILAESAEWFDYDLPPEFAAIAWSGRYRGQTQRWFAMRFTGVDDDIDLENSHGEFAEWRWVEIDALPDMVIGFKRQVYEAVVRDFRPLAARVRKLA
jgi:putative (di)nucleoside polyphosphate hydrolase